MDNRPIILLLLAFALHQASPMIARAAEREVDFNRDIRPILSDNCFHCHGPDPEARKADLRLDSFEGATEDRDGVRAIDPANLPDSELLHRILSTGKSEKMPPPKSRKELAPDEISALRKWVEAGAPFEKHWAFVPPKKSPLPEVTITNRPANRVDHFVLAKLEAEGLAPSPGADPVTLLRRLHFDLTGLPPAPTDVEHFIREFEIARAADEESASGRNGETPKTIDAVTGSPPRHLADSQNQTRSIQILVEDWVDGLLASPRFGERLAIYWLDLVRYADTVGYHGDQDHNIAPYRDWVVDAFNDNMPFDQFTREQLAGDLLPDPTIDQKIATGYNRLLQTSHEGGVQEKEYLAIYAADRVRNVSNVWMGGTLGCAQCHDHKYDAYTTSDFYSMAAFFADIDENTHLNPERSKGINLNGLPTSRPPEIKVLTTDERSRLAALEADLTEAAVASEPVETLESEIAALRARARKTMITVALAEPRTIRVLPRGNWLDDSGDVVTPAIPAFLGALDTGGRRATRLDLANWLTDPANGAGGLTARVFANRFWYLFFGTGISRSLDDFGGQGEPPANPELLDGLAIAFLESGWDIKALVRLLVTSRAYRQTSLASPELRQRDPHNQLVARQSRYRLPAEMVRDNALAVSGLLVLDRSGLSARPYQPEGYYRHLNFPKRKYVADTDDRQWRRGLYVHWQRQFLHPMLAAMDAPSREECTAQRARSNTPNAALVLLNDPTFVEAARVFAARIIAEGGETFASRLNRAFRLALSRAADDEEQMVMRNLLAAARAEYEQDVEAASELLETGLAPVPGDIDPVELASWTAVTRAILNLNETMTRN